MITTYEENEYCIIYNGQIYNVPEIKNILAQNGFKFTTTSDTEVLLKAFIFYGYDVVKHLNGIFALQYGIKIKKNYF